MSTSRYNICWSSFSSEQKNPLVKSLNLDCVTRLQTDKVPGIENQDMMQMVENILICKNGFCRINVLNFPVWERGAASVRGHGVGILHIKYKRRIKWRPEARRGVWLKVATKDKSLFFLFWTTPKNFFCCCTCIERVHLHSVQSNTSQIILQHSFASVFYNRQAANLQKYSSLVSDSDEQRTLLEGEERCNRRTRALSVYKKKWALRCLWKKTWRKKKSI